MKGIVHYAYAVVMLVSLIACSDSEKEDFQGDEMYYTVSESNETKGSTAIISGLGTYKTGASVVIKAKSGAQISGVKTRGSGSFGSTYESGGYACANISDIHGDWTVSAHIPDFTVTVKAGAGGTASGGGTVEKGSSTNISASPSSGYTFSKWTLTSGSGSFTNSGSSSTSFKPNSDCTVTATFVMSKKTIHIFMVGYNTSSSGIPSDLIAQLSEPCEYDIIVDAESTANDDYINTSIPDPHRLSCTIRANTTEGFLKPRYIWASGIRTGTMTARFTNSEANNYYTLKCYNWGIGPF